MASVASVDATLPVGETGVCKSQGESAGSWCGPERSDYTALLIVLAARRWGSAPKNLAASAADNAREGSSPNGRDAFGAGRALRLEPDATGRHAGTSQTVRARTVDVKSDRCQPIDN
jgi:hypothetical protein